MDEALRSSYMTHAEAEVIAEAIAKVPELARQEVNCGGSITNFS
jgi:hypothetical protein